MKRRMTLLPPASAMRLALCRPISGSRLRVRRRERPKIWDDMICPGRLEQRGSPRMSDPQAPDPRGPPALPRVWLYRVTIYCGTDP
jgi:hypothetical protein